MPSAVNPSWQLRASANIDGVGGPELIYQHTSTHQLYVWFLSGTSLAAGSYLTPDAVTGTWQIVGGK